MSRGARFSDFHGLTARMDSAACINGPHAIKRGDQIGYSRRHGAVCAACWSRWCAENAEADAYEARYGFGGVE